MGYLIRIDARPKKTKWGPASTLCNHIRRLGWTVQAEGLLVFNNLILSLTRDAWGKIKTLLISAWEDVVVKEIGARKGLRTLTPRNLRLTRQILFENIDRPKQG